MLLLLLLLLLLLPLYSYDRSGLLLLMLLRVQLVRGAMLLLLLLLVLRSDDKQGTINDAEGGMEIQAIRCGGVMECGGRATVYSYPPRIANWEKRVVQTKKLLGATQRTQHKSCGRRQDTCQAVQPR